MDKKARMRARGSRDATRQLVREMHGTLGKLVSSHNQMTRVVAEMGVQLQTLSGQAAALGEKVILLETAHDDLDARVTRLENKRGGK